MPDTRVPLTTMAVIVAAVATLIAGGPQAAYTPSDWTIPATASQEHNPIAVSTDVLEKGRKIFESRCQRCHGKDGKGHGPEADHEHPAGNFTDRMRAAFNPDGVMFYRIWNGRDTPKMPAFRKDGMSRDEVWTVIHFVKTFRK